MKKLYILSALLLLSGLASAQTASDMVRFSTRTGTGSARSAAMGGTFGALGGDLSNIGVNPAGIGVFNQMEFSITPVLNIARVKSGNRVGNQASIQLGTLGGVVAFHNPNSNWKSFNLGINYAILNDFNRTTNQVVNNSSTSFTEIWADNANYGCGAREEMALNIGLINFNSETGLYEPTLLPSEEVNQRKYIKEDGYQREYDFSFGTNYKDKLYLGMTIGIQSIYYKNRSIFTGKGNDTNFFGLDKYNFGQYLKTKGVGANFKFGLIYRPIPELRLGAAIHTPTFYSMKDNYSEDMRSEFYKPDADNNYAYESYIIPYTYHYDMQTPWRAVFSVATVFSQKMVLSFDYEYTDYTSAQFSNGDGEEDFYESNETGVNDQNMSILRATHNFRVGAEYLLNSTFSLRGGYSYWASPYNMTNTRSIFKNNPKIQAVSAGFGINSGIFFFDAAYVYKFSKDITAFYNLEDAEDSAYDITATPVHNKYINHEARFTLGVRF